MMENEAYLSLGSNMGERLDYLKKACELLEEDEKIHIRKASSIYETDPVGYTEQPNFLNMALLIGTSYTPQQLLDKCQAVEAEIGRIRKIRWGPRTIDLDILLYNHENIETESLSVPHPRMTERAFVLIPMLEINPDIKLAALDLTLDVILQNIPDKEGVRLWKRKNGEGVSGLFEN